MFRRVSKRIRLICLEVAKSRVSEHRQNFIHSIGELQMLFFKNAFDFVRLSKPELHFDCADSGVMSIFAFPIVPQADVGHLVALIKEMIF